MTNTRTSSGTFTVTYTPTATATITNTYTVTFTRTNSGTFTATATPTDTFTVTNTRTDSGTFTNTYTPTNTATITNTYTTTFTPTNSGTFTFTYTPTQTFTVTNTRTNSGTFTATFTPTQTYTITNTATVTSTRTNSGTFTQTFTFTPTYTITATRTNSPTFTLTFTRTNTLTFTATRTFTNTPTLTFTPTITRTPSFSLTPTFDPTQTGTATMTYTPGIFLSAAVYNEAGERVRTIQAGLPPMLRAPSDFIIAPNPFSPDGDGYQDVTYVTFPDGSSFSWDGRNDRGEIVTNGSYWIHVTMTTVTGIRIGEIIKSVVVLARGNLIRVCIYDAAGNERRCFLDYRLPAQLTDVNAFPNPFSPGTNNNTGAWNTMLIQLSGSNALNPPTPAPTPNNNLGITIYWLGDDDLGHLVENGTYWIHAQNIDPAGKTTRIDKSITILRGSKRLLVDLLAYPNPHHPVDGANTMYFAYTVVNGDSVYVLVRIYDLQGRLVASTDSTCCGSPDPTGVANRYRVSWDAQNPGGGYVADGLYFAQYDAYDQTTGIRQTLSLKFVISRK